MANNNINAAKLRMPYYNAIQHIMTSNRPISNGWTEARERVEGVAQKDEVALGLCECLYVHTTS